MSEKNKRNQKSKKIGFNKLRNNIAVTLTCIATLLGILSYALPSSSPFFNVNIKNTEYAGIEYVEYQIVCSDENITFHAKAIPYIIVEGTYISLLNQFTQEEYCSENENKCTLLREDTTSQLVSRLKKIYGEETINEGCLIAIEYVVDDKKVKEIFILKTGTLTHDHDEKIPYSEVVSNYMGEKEYQIDMRIYPINQEKILKEIQKII